MSNGDPSRRHCCIRDSEVVDEWSSLGTHETSSFRGRSLWVVPYTTAIRGCHTRLQAGRAAARPWVALRLHRRRASRAAAHDQRHETSPCFGPMATPRFSVTADAAPVSTGIAGLDHLLLGGLTPNRMYLVEGPSGHAARRRWRVQFLLEGRARGERGLYVALSETVGELARRRPPRTDGRSTASSCSSCRRRTSPPPRTSTRSTIRPKSSSATRSGRCSTSSIGSSRRASSSTRSAS